MSDLERRVWWLLRAYPQPWRAERGDDLVATVLAMAKPEQRWPSTRATIDLVANGWSERAHRHRRVAGGWLAAGWRVAAVAAVIMQVVAAMYWLRQWFVHGTVGMLHALNGASEVIFVVAMGGFIAATVTWLSGLVRTTRLLAGLAATAWGVTALVVQLLLSGSTGRPEIMLLGWTYVFALAAWGLWQPRPSMPVAIGSLTVVASLGALAATPSNGPLLVVPAWCVAALAVVLMARIDPRGVIAASLLLPLVVLLHPPWIATLTPAVASVAVAVLVAAMAAPRAASNR